MTTRDDIIARLTAPGTPFELELREINGVPLRVFANAPSSMRDIFLMSAEAGDRPFLYFADEVLSYAQVHEQVASVGSWLVNQGVRPGDRIAIGMRNYPEWPIAYWAIVSIGAIAVSLNAWWIADELSYALQDSSCRMVFVDGERHDRITDAMQEALGVTQIVARGTPRTNAVSWQEVASLHGESLPSPEISPEDDCTILYTSGTTGFPKGAVATHRNHVTNVWNTLFAGLLASEIAKDAGIEVSPPSQQPISLWTFPFFHIAGVTGINITTATQGALFTQYKWDPLEALQAIDKYKVTAIAGVPTVVRSLLEHPDVSSYDLSSIGTISQGGAPVPPDSIKKIEGDFKRQVNPTNGYGLTETTSAIISNSGLSYFAKSDSVGLPMLGADIRIVNEEGNDIPDGEVGELWVRSPNNVRGYWNKPEETSQAFDDGWFKSGDAARRDNDGFIYVVDRIKDVVLRGGENVYCAEVEAVLFEHDSVGDVAVIGIPHDSLGEEVAAVIVPRSNANDHNSESLRQFALSKLAGFKVPAKIFWQNDPLPRNATGKVLKKELRDTYGKN